MHRTGDVIKVRKKAQTMIELAVFGAVLFFLIGGIASNYISGSQQQQAQLQALRKALLSSYQSGQAGKTERVAASTLVFEDRLTGEGGKYATMERQPVVMGGSGLLSIQAMQPGIFNEPNSSPLMDLVVNGKAFQFRTNAYVQYVIALKPDNTVQIIQVKAVADDQLPVVSTIPAMGTCSGGAYNACASNSNCGHGTTCVKTPVDIPKTQTEFMKDAVTSCLTTGSAGDPVQNCNAGTPEQRARLAREWLLYPNANGDPLFFYHMMSNDPLFHQSAGRTPIPGIDELNLLRDGDSSHVFPSSSTLEPAWKWAWDSLTAAIDKIDENEGSYPAYDVDGDLDEENVFQAEDVTSVYCASGACRNAYRVGVQDSSLADVDPSKDASDFTDPAQAPGMRQETQIKSEVSAETEVKEGWIFSDSLPYNISKATKKQSDMIERIYQMNVNMNDPAGFIALNSSVIEAANNCTSAANETKTCFDTNTKTLYIRSRLSNQRGHKWVTNRQRTWDQSVGGE